jgi:hypothetical protein
MLRRPLWLAALVLLAASTWAAPVLARKGNTKCHSNPSYLVVEREMKNWRSEYILKKKAYPSDALRCEFVLRPGDFHIGRQGKRYVFIALKDDLLVMRESRGKGGDYREYLNMFDLKDEAKETNLGEVYLTGYADEESIPLLIPSKLKPSKENCPDYAHWFDEDPRSGIDAKAVARTVKTLRFEQEAVFSFQARRVVESAKMECRYNGD